MSTVSTDLAKAAVRKETGNNPPAGSTSKKLKGPASKGGKQGNSGSGLPKPRG